MRWLLLLLAIAPASAQDAAPKRPVEIQALVDRARALPQEFSADLHLNLAASPLIADTQWKRELIEEAFLSGARAPLPYRRRGEPHTDSRTAKQVEANDLEALTLQTRAVEAMLAFDPQRALAMYDAIAAPDLPPVPCTEIITPNVAAWYDTAAKVFERGFTAKQREKGDDLHFLKQRIAAMRSPSQVVPSLRLIFAVKISDEQRKELVTTFSVTLDRLSGSDREYGPSEVLLVPAALPQWHDTPLFVPALRHYIVRQLSGPRCSDLIGERQMPISANQFNNLARRLDPAENRYRQIAPEEVKPLKIDGTYKPSDFWRSPRSKQLLEALRWLNHGNRTLPGGGQRFWTPEERASLEWNQRYMDLLKTIEGWKESEEDSPVDHLCMVASTYATLASLVPPGMARENAMGMYLNFLETRYSATENRNLWFSLARHMLGTAQSNQDPKDREWILDRLSRSANPMIALYAELAAEIDRRLGP